MAIFVNSQTKLTYEDYVLLPEDGRIHEIIDGDHYVTPAPNTYHQRISRRIQAQLYNQIEVPGNGEVFDAPTDVELSRIDIVQPDLLVILQEHLRRISPAKIIGAPDLVIEILSESTQEKDEALKLALYQRGGVPEYWIVDPTSQQVRKFLNQEGRLIPAGVFHDSIEFSGLPGIAVNLAQVW